MGGKYWVRYNVLKYCNLCPNKCFPSWMIDMYDLRKTLLGCLFVDRHLRLSFYSWSFIVWPKKLYFEYTISKTFYFDVVTNYRNTIIVFCFVYIKVE